MAKFSGIKFLRLVLGNIVIGVTVAALCIVALSGGDAKRVETEPIYSGESKASVSLMVNVYWGTEYIEPMLNTFDRYNVKTTFFVGGSWAASNPSVLKQIYDAGHEIGNHGYYHKDHKKIDAEYNRREITAAHDAVKEILGIDMTLFAPPSGAFGNDTLTVAESLNYRTIMWTRDTVDWRDHDADVIYRRAVKNISGGDLILMHPTEATVKALERIIIQVFSNGLKIEPVSKVLTSVVIS